MSLLKDKPTSKTAWILSALTLLIIAAVWIWLGGFNSFLENTQEDELIKNITNTFRIVSEETSDTFDKAGKEIEKGKLEKDKVNPELFEGELEQAQEKDFLDTEDNQK